MNKIRDEKLKSLKSLEELYSGQTGIISSSIEVISKLAANFEEKIRIRQQQIMFERSHNILALIKPAAIYKDVIALPVFMSELFSKKFWESKFAAAGANDIYILVFHIIAIAGTFAILKKLKSHLKLTEILTQNENFLYTQQILVFINKSVTLFVLAAFLFIYANYREYTGLYAFFNPMQKITATILLLYWLDLALSAYRKKNDNILINYIKDKKSGIINFLYIFSSIYIIIEWISGSGSTILLLMRLSIEISMIAGFIIIWKKIYSARTEANQETSRNSAKWFANFITITGFILEITGYGYLSIHWYKVWIITATVSSWLYFCLMALKEWDDSVKPDEAEMQASMKEGGGERNNIYPLYWLGIRTAAIFIILLGIGAVAYSWGAREKVFEAFWGLLTHKIQFGNTAFSIFNTILSVIVIIITKALTKIWHSIMMGHVLKNSGIESGLKDSITTISSYLIWGLGILASMHTFGLSTTSLTVGFGALGIGLGFGLQNIFSNFISGLILLFERPIQVGDVVEINSVMGKVTKINVRSTLVQTYSNASFIIPNSEFISNKVINWSHKDPYIRRDVTVGVAYGTDPEKVKELLLEAADAVPEVINFPVAPSVTFINFGESSLDFRVRIWSTIDEFVAAESKLRFKIEKIFRENGISMPFPQREIRIIKE